MQVATAQLGVEVHQHANRARRSANDVELPGTEQRNIAEAERTRRSGRELRAEIIGRGEDDADELVVIHIIAVQHLGDQ